MANKAFLRSETFGQNQAASKLLMIPEILGVRQMVELLEGLHVRRFSSFDGVGRS
jgi:hypothetical protein